MSHEKFLSAKFPRTSAAPPGRNAPSRPLRVALIGCGAITEHGYLPALQATRAISAHYLIDANRDRAADLATRWGVPHIGSEPGELTGKVDAAVVAVPNHLHVSIACDLLRQSLPVMVEKPMALNAKECDEMLAAAREGNATLAVGFVCRFSRAARMAKELFESGVLGSVRTFRAENGAVFSWPVRSDYLFRRETAGGGVLIDLGSHMLDLLTWWFGPVVNLTHLDDSHGGVEADSLTHLKMESGAKGALRLSRTCRIEPGILVECEKARLYIRLAHPTLEIRFRKSALYLESEVIEAGNGVERSQTFVDLLAAQAEAWATSLQEGRNYPADGQAGRQVAALIDRCYARRQSWQLPWIAPKHPGPRTTEHSIHCPKTANTSSSRKSLAGKRVLVTGGTGFIGARLVEKLVLEQGAQVRVLVRDFSRVSRIARFPVELVAGKLDDLENLRRAVRGCSVVFHCAYSGNGTGAEQWATNVEGTDFLAEAVVAEGVARLVHVSSLAVYGKTPTGPIDETAPRRKWGNVYALSKREAERRLLERFRRQNLPVVIIQPSIVYGPYGNWTVCPLEWLQTGRVVLLDGGSGYCNCVYVDDVVDALLLAATQEGVLGHAFLISSDRSVPWRDFWGAYEKMLGLCSTVSLSARTCRRHEVRRKMTPRQLAFGLDLMRHPKVRSRLFGSRVWRVPGLSHLRARLVGGHSSGASSMNCIHWPDTMQIDQGVMKTTLNLDKAKSMLGYRPRCDFATGMALTGEWAKWARLLPDGKDVWERPRISDYDQ